MSYALRRQVIGSKAKSELTAAEYGAISGASEGLFEALHIEEKFDVFVENYAEFEIELAKAAAAYMIGEDINYQSLQRARNLFNRRLINVLSSGRLYLDQLAHHGTKLESLGVILDVSPIASEQYDQSLGYRVMAALRNYVQHRGYPIHSVTYRNTRVADEDGDERLRHTIAPYLDPGELEIDKKFKASVLQELKALGERVDIKPLLRTYVEAVGVIHKFVRVKLRPNIAEWEGIVNAMVHRFRESQIDDASIVGLEALRLDDEGEVQERTPIFLDHIEYRKHLERKNLTQANMSRRFVTTESVRH